MFPAASRLAALAALVLRRATYLRIRAAIKIAVGSPVALASLDAKEAAK